ncbi:LytTR family transcriptional regulator DNA-binding domain-containing protein [Macrococcus capreoli]|uniref:LytTR family transcriptional regulator DNA-binding domain-containing protein n=1 Tax=Macrococcus capreoli TaxID=2982690 RepID=UPI003EE63077
MKINIQYNNHLIENLVNIETHETNKELINNFVNIFETKVTLLDIRMNKSIRTNINNIESIETFTHLSKVNLIDKSQYYIKGRLKDFENFNQYKIVRINNNQMFNLYHLYSISVDKGSRLIIQSSSQNEFIVSRFYAKKIKEML